VKGAPRFLVVLAAATVVATAGVAFGAWWLTFAVGLAVGVALPRGRWAILAGAVAGLLGWALPLAWDHMQYGLGPTASSLAAIMGFTGAAVVPVILTLVVGLLLGLTGAWLAAAARGMFLRPLRWEAGS
jgi:hypothetical protein